MSAPHTPLAEEFLARLLDENGPAPNMDWDRFRLMQLIPGTAGADAKAREQLVARGFVELGKGVFDADSERRSLASLRSLFRQVLGPRHRIVAFNNPMVHQFASGPSPATPPNLARLLSAFAEILRNAQAVSVVPEGDTLGERLMTLLFVDGAYVGFLPGRLSEASVGASGPRGRA